MTPCRGTTRAGQPCTRTAGPEGLCDRHDPAQAAARGRNGGLAKASRERAERERVAASLATATLADLRDALTAALRGAYATGDFATVVSAVRVGTELLKTGEIERQVAELVELMRERVPSARRALGGN